MTSVLAQARSAIATIARSVGNRVGICAKADTDIASAISAVTTAEKKTLGPRGALARVADDTKKDVAALQALLANTQTADRHHAAQAVQLASGKAKQAADALGGLEEKFDKLRADITAARTLAGEAKSAHAAAKVVVEKTAATL